jgi:hypothetical protein
VLQESVAATLTPKRSFRAQSVVGAHTDDSDHEFSLGKSMGEKSHAASAASTLPRPKGLFQNQLEGDSEEEWD